MPHLLLRALHWIAISSREKLKPLIRLPTKALWTPFLTGIPLTSSPAMSSTAERFVHRVIHGFVMHLCMAFHLVYIFSSQRHPTACCPRFLLSPFRIHFINDVFSNYFCLPPPHTLLSLALLMSRPITTPTFMFTLVSLPTFEHQLHGVRYYSASHYI